MTEKQTQTKIVDCVNDLSGGPLEIFCKRQSAAVAFCTLYYSHLLQAMCLLVLPHSKGNDFSSNTVDIELLVKQFVFFQVENQHPQILKVRRLSTMKKCAYMRSHQSIKECNPRMLSRTVVKFLLDVIKLKDMLDASDQMGRIMLP